MLAEIKIHESVLNKARVGLQVRVTTDGLPGKVFPGKLEKIAPLPDAQSVWLNPDLKVYNGEVYLMGDVSGLRSGMSCLAEIIIDRFEHALYVPVQAVFRMNGQPTVYVDGPDGPEARAIQIGMDNNRMVQVTQGLKEGERVSLIPPLDDAALSEERLTLPPL
jgi:HlyD family secretion protein